MIEVINSISGESSTLLSRPWWTTHAFESGNRICVARAYAQSNSRRENYDINGSRISYKTGTFEEGFIGPFCVYMIDLTQQEIDSIKSHPEYTILADMSNNNSVDTPRPKTNHLGKISSKAEQRALMDDLQAEGCLSSDLVDKTPYHKGDDYAE